MPERKPVEYDTVPAGRGGQIPDPTQNVQNLVTAGFKRVDDLLEERDKLRVVIQDKDLLLAAAESRRVDEQAAMRDRFSVESRSIDAKHYEDLRLAESKRIDAIRNVDVEARKADNERAAAQATLLATQLATTAETLRNQVATTANAAQTQLQQLIAPLAEKVAVLEQSLYKGQGKEAVSDPALAQLIADTRALRAEQREGAGRGAGASATIAYIIAGISALGGIIALIFLLRP